MPLVKVPRTCEHGSKLSGSVVMALKGSTLWDPGCRTKGGKMRAHLVGDMSQK